MIYQYQIRLLIVIGESEWFLMVQKIISSLTTIILSILFPLARWATIEMLSNSPPTFPIAPGEWATTKGTPCDTRVYTNITQIENSDSLQTDLNYIYLWAINNNMLFNHQKFNYISFSSSMSSINTNVYYSPSLDIIKPSENVFDLGITMSRNCSFDVHINILCKKMY